MSRRTLILLTTLLLVVAVGMTWVVIRRNNAPASQAANAPVTTGISLVFSATLSSEYTASVATDSGEAVKDFPLKPAASRYNLDLPSGVYQLTIIPKDKNLPAFPAETITISNGTLSELTLNLPSPSHEE